MTTIRCKRVYAFHATRPRYRAEIERTRTFRVGPRCLYGTGVYFWSKREDAEAFGRLQYGSDWVILEQPLLIVEPSGAVNWGIYWPSDQKPFANKNSNPLSKLFDRSPDPAYFFSKMLRKEGTRLVVIRATNMLKTTLPSANGEAYCWLGEPEEYISLDSPSLLTGLPGEVDNLPPSGQWYEVSIRLPEHKSSLRMSESDYRNRLDAIYDEHLGKVSKNAYPAYIFQQAGKVYAEMYALNYDTGHWNYKLQYGKYDHDLAYLVACRIKDRDYPSIARFSKEALAKEITDQILAYLEHKQRYGFLLAGRPYMLSENLLNDSSED